MRATGDTLPFHAVVVLIAGAAWRFVGVATALPRGSAQSRESLTQDSRSAVKARMFDPLRESFGERRCTSCKAGVAASKRPSRGFESTITWRNAAQMARRCGCARTSLAVASGRRARSAMRARYGLTPRRARELDG